MDRLLRIYSLHRLLAGRRVPIRRAEIEQRLECSRATVKRIVEEMREQLGAPIVYERERNGYLYSHDAYELPGLWFTASELYALHAAQRLLSEAEPGLVGKLLDPLRLRIEKLLAHERAGGTELARRVRILSLGSRCAGGEHFQAIAGALAERRRIEIVYHGRARDERTDRIVSPQRLVHYRDNWYLDAWCHGAEALRSFALERIRFVRPHAGRAVDVTDERLDAHFSASYGIFGGAPTGIAVLRFTPERARWVAEERWHREQEGRMLPDGSYELRIPYSDPRELVLDILRYGPDVEVVEPEALRDEVRARLAAALARYDSPRQP